MLPVQTTDRRLAMINRNGHGAMAQELKPQPDSSRPMADQIRITGPLGSSMGGLVEGLTITLDGGDTLITGPVVDQAALRQLLKRVRDLGMPLVSVSPIESGPRRSRQARQVSCQLEPETHESDRVHRLRTAGRPGAQGHAQACPPG